MVRERKEYKVVELIHRRRLSHGDGSLGPRQAILLRSAVSAQWVSGCPQAMGVPLQHTWLPRTGDGTNHPRSSSVQPTPPDHPHRLTPTQATHPHSVVHRSVARSTPPPHLPSCYRTA